MTDNAAKAPAHCDNERICYLYRDAMLGRKRRGSCIITPCNNDSRPRLTPNSAKAAALEALKLAADEWGMLACVKKENTDEFMEYLEQRQKEFEGRYESLRREQEHGS